jgi:hypothetical protein
MRSWPALFPVSLLSLALASPAVLAQPVVPCFEWEQHSSSVWVAHGWISGPNAALIVNDSITQSTWTTQSGTTKPNRLILTFNQLRPVNRLRFYKRAEGGIGAGIDVPKDLHIEYTIHPVPSDILINPHAGDPFSTPHEAWKRVSGLTNGFQGIEPFNATAVNPNGEVLGDAHDSFEPGWGWGSLSFDTVYATGISVVFANSQPSITPAVHYKLYEVDPFYDSPTAVAPYGTGTPGCLGEHTLSAQSCPETGSDDFTLLCTNAPPSGLRLLIVSLEDTPTPIDSLGIDVLMNVELFGAVPPIYVPLVDGADDTVTATIPVPQDPALQGLELFAQAAFLWGPTCPDGSPSHPPAGGSSSNGVSVVIP